ncbi:MAG: alanine racemase [Anaerolineae bacterium]|nr:alanine racemase [Anaerolineae bacterium]
MDITNAATWLEIKRAAIVNNLQRLRQITATDIMAVVKGNAYGHGLVEVSRTAVAAGATWVGVARLEEAALLRENGITTPILVMSYTHPARSIEAAELGVTLTAYNPQQADELARQMQGAASPLMVHAKINTGMNRLGVLPEEGADFLRQLNRLPALQVTGMFTHFCCADEWQHPTTARQLSRFIKLVEQVNHEGIRPAVIHASSSAAMLYENEARFDLCRAGIAMYGLQPSSETPLLDGFEPALSWKARLVAINHLPPGEGVGYNHRYFTTKNERIGVFSAGYGDGVRRRPGNIIILRGKILKVIGICMDQCMVNLDEVPDAQVGDEVVLIGRQGEASITPQDIAANWQTTNYEMVTGLSARVPRFYI